MNSRLLKYLLDLESIIDEIERITLKVNNNFATYSSDFIVKRAIERDLEIIGEVINKIQKLEDKNYFSNASKIIGLRNLIIHSYDSVEDAIIWGVIQNHIPQLKIEVQRIKNQL